MQVIVGFCRYALPLLAFIILFKCLLTLLIGHPVNKTYGYIVDSVGGEKIPLNTWETSIGRSRSCDIVLAFQSVSRFHAAICRRVDGWYIFDTNSKFGTKVNGKNIDREAMIKNNDILTFGDLSFQFVIVDDPVIEVGKKRRRSKKNAATEQANNSYRRVGEDSEPISTPTNERYDDFESIQIDFHPKKQPTKEGYSGRIKDVYSETGQYNSDVPKGANARSSQAKQATLADTKTGETFALCADRITVGRSRNCDVRVDERSVSRNHALMSKEHGRWYISDSGSTYGTTVGGEQVLSKTLLHSGDIISLGNAKLKFDYK